jgi:hypothetical protein
VEIDFKNSRELLISGYTSIPEVNDQNDLVDD